MSEEMPTKLELDNTQGLQMMPVAAKPSLLDRLASVCYPGESPIAVMMGAMLNPTAENLSKISSMFNQLIDKTPEFPDYVRDSAHAFMASIDRWTAERSAANVK
jgi:hypothetical protein